MDEVFLEAEEEEEEEEEEVEEESSEDEHEDEGALDGGVAEPLEAGKPRRKASEADIILFITCTETLPHCPHHPILKTGVTVQIGMQKISKLRTVFNRYIDYCNENYPKKKIDMSFVEFVHTQVLNPDDNAESAALMKNDRISVRREQSNDRRELEVQSRLQREADKDYFSSLKSLLPPSATDKYADIILNCNATPNSASLPCHSFLIRKRCPWLYKKLEAAEMGVPLDQEPVAPSGAAKIESDDDDMGRLSHNSVVEPDYDSFSKTWVTLNHPPEAVRILLEYIYSNRVVDLGLEAFTQSCRTKPQYKKGVGPVPPHSMRATKWPNLGQPVVSLEVALSALDLAKAAQLERLALMCEIAASRLVDSRSALDALRACQKHGGVPKLRKAAMECVLEDPTVVDNLQTDESDKELIGTILAGTLDVIEKANKNKKEKKRDWQRIAFSNFEMYDKLDCIEREAERQNVEDSVWGKFKTKTLKRVMNHKGRPFRKTRKRRANQDP